VRRATLITLIVLFVLLAIAAAFQIHAGSGPRLNCSEDPACRSPVPTASSSFSP
jgi:hypothetical protein